jgi:alkylated DNA repair dioxygenase AlkB
MSVTLPEGFFLVRAWAAEMDFAKLHEAIAWTQHTTRVHGKEHPVPRMECWMGDAPYTYSGRTYDPAPLPAIVDGIRAHLEMFLEVRYTFNSVLANLYRDGRDSVAWHADDEPELGSEPTIASLSFGAPRDFAIKSKLTGERTTIKLRHGDLLVMTGRSQADYLHSVPKRANAGERINLTFRRTFPL